MHLANISEVINDIELAVEEKRPFSLIRFGDGGLKLIKRFLNDKIDFSSCRKEGIPFDFIPTLIEKWAEVANDADYIDCGEYYFRQRLHRLRGGTSDHVFTLLQDWKKYYSAIGINLDRNYCSPETGLLLFSDMYDDMKKNMFDIIKDKKICCITDQFRFKTKLSKVVKSLSLKIIPGFYGNHYNISYESIMEEIEEEATSYDLWFIGAGELGRIYTGYIKKNGGIGIDIGRVFDAWSVGLDKRLKTMATIDPGNGLLFELEDEPDLLRRKK